MSLVPEFKIGLWNVWIFISYFQLVSILSILADKGVLKRGLPDQLYNRAEKKIYRILIVIYYPALLYSIFLPIKFGTIWFYLGFPICLFGEVVFTIAVLEFLKTPIDKPLTRGIYRFSRHPMYVAIYLIFIGVGVASASWLFLAYSIFYIVLQSILVVPEEQFCLDKYGDAYREYMNKTPKYLC